MRTGNYSANQSIVDSIGDLWRAGFVESKPWGDHWVDRIDGHEYKPNAGQLAFHESDARFKILFGGRGGGKTATGSQEALRTRIRHGLSGAVINPDFENFKFSTWPEFKQWIPWDRVIRRDRRMGEFGWEPRSSFIIHFMNGAVVYCKGLRDPDAARGPNLNWLWYDEGGRDKTGLSWKLAIAGIRIGPNPAAWVTTTPRGSGHWTAKTFINHEIDDVVKQILESTGHSGSLYSVNYTSIHDNRANLDPIFYASLLTMYAGLFAEQELDGIVIGAVRGLVYRNFGTDNITDFADYDPARGPVEIGYDDGFSTSPRVMLFIQIDDDGIVNVFDEIYHFRHDEQTCIDEAKLKLIKHMIPFFETNKINTTRAGETIQYGDKWRPAQNKPMVRAMFEIAVGDPSAPVLRMKFRRADIAARLPKIKSVIEGIKLVYRLIKSDAGVVGVRVHPRAKNVIREFGELYKWPDRGDESEDWQWDESTKPVKSDDHTPDALRYWATLRMIRRV